MEEVSYRRAAAADIAALVELCAAFLAEIAGADPADPTLRESLLRYFAAAVPSGEFVSQLALAGGRVVGTSGLVYHRHPPSAKNLSGLEAYVMNMYTVPEWRGRGVGSALLRELVAIARQANCRRIRLHAFPKAISLYARAGFVAVSGEMEIDLRT